MTMPTSRPVRTGLLAGAAALALAACAPPQRLVPPPPPTVAQVVNGDPTARCMAAANHDPRMAVLVPRLGSVTTAGQAPLEMLTSDARPNYAERQALTFWGNERQRCLGLGSAYRAQHFTPALASAFERSQRGLVELTAQLAAGQLGYGEFNSRRQDLAAAYRAPLVEFQQQYQAWLGEIEPQRRTGLPVPPRQQTALSPAARALFTGCTAYDPDNAACATP